MTAHLFQMLSETKKIMMKVTVYIYLICVMVVSISALKCQNGYVKHKTLNKCEPCNPGYYHNKDINMCIPCSFGEYSYKRGSSKCLKCHRKYSSTHFVIASTGCDHNIFVENTTKIVNETIKYVMSFF